MHNNASIHLLTLMNAPSTPSSSTVSYRLLYRGALSLPDSYLTLDGITFCAQIDTPSKRPAEHSTTFGHSNDSLLENPLALALETMRGRPTLRFVGTIGLQDEGVWMDESGGVLMDIHPYAALTRVYFENLFCVGMVADDMMKRALCSVRIENEEECQKKVAEKSNIGVKVALGDTDGPETTYMVIYARLLPLSSLTSPSTSLQTASQFNRPLESSGRVVQLSVARLMPRPPEPHPRPRMPRPDDPIPRKPPLILLRGSKVVSAAKSALNKSTRELKRAASMGGSGVLTKRPRLDSQMSEFKIPDVPVKEGDVKGKGKGKEKERLGDEVDVFGTNVMNKGKVDGIGGEKRRREGGAGDGEDESEVESLNKTAIKKATVDFLAKTKDPTRAGVFVERSHPDFKEIFQWIYRGASFALRGRMKNEVVEGSMILRLVRKHGEMYIGGLGGE